VGSSYTRFLMREHSKHETPPGGEVSFDQFGVLSINLVVGTGLRHRVWGGYD